MIITNYLNFYNKFHHRNTGMCYKTIVLKAHGLGKRKIDRTVPAHFVSHKVLSTLSLIRCQHERESDHRVPWLFHPFLNLSDNMYTFNGWKPGLWPNQVILYHADTQANQSDSHPLNLTVFLKSNASLVRTCWIYFLCKSIRIYKNQNTGIDPKCGSIKGSILVFWFL